MDFTSYGRWAVDLANTYNPRSRVDPEQLPDLSALRALLADRPSWQRRATKADLEQLKEIRRRIRAVFEATDGAARVRLLNQLLAEQPVHPELSGHDDTDWHLHLAPRNAPVWQEYAAGAVLGLAAQVQEYGVDRLGQCSGETCADVFVDTSANRSRRYCSEGCANRANVKAWRERQRQGAGRR